MFVVASMTMKHLHVIDVLRGFAAVSVCCFHFAGHPAMVGEIPAVIQSVTSRGHLGVAVFFVISGFVIPFSMRDWRLTSASFRAFLSRRFLRLYPPYLIATVCALGLWLVSALAPGFRGTSPSLSILDAIGNLTMTADILSVPWILVVAWSLAIELQFYVAIACLLPLLTQTRSGIRLAALAGWTALPLLANQPQFVSAYAASFGMGVAVYLNRTGRLTRIWLVIFLVLTTAIEGWTHSPENAAAGLATAFALFARARERRLTMWLGSISYSLYLVHVPIGGRLLNLGLRLPPFPGRGFVLFAIASAASLLAAALFFRWVERPWIERSRRWGTTVNPAIVDAPTVAPDELIAVRL